jgi:peroxiredoxin
MACLEVGEPAPELQLVGPGDRALALSELWREAPVVLVFLRHFG